MTRRPAHKPSLALTSTDFTRAVWELGAYAWMWPTMVSAPISDDTQPVLVLPGFTTPDMTTLPLRTTLKALGYPTYGWGLGVNIGPSRRILRGMRRRLDEVYDEHGQPVSLVGWSLGGIFARELARETPEKVRQVITLGSPFRMETEEQSRAKPAFDLMSPFHARPLGVPLEADAPPLAMPSTAFYSRYDGVVAWQTCRDQPTELSENIEVVSSHLGFGHNLAAVWGVADRLAQPAGRLTPFTPPRWLRPAFPR
ncbi:alpha/beta hydrolase [Gordonia hydrophobica]|uniref:Alpha/beta hydrolase n=1 Tax=Gordonia hydrophobica TaxID=40516 RepID=A0ABZ2TXF3_9ACTN|nr:alpha/beta hydrolase [Gordonia hydrophobica]MBM7366268.1 pimeloyl-ACP methyl ester carboxylesterase [Gordonia hydrophobica]